MTQHGTGNYDYDRLVYLLEAQEGNHTHYFGKCSDGRLRPLTPEQAREARLADVPIELPGTALLTREDE